MLISTLYNYRQDNVWIHHRIMSSITSTTEVWVLIATYNVKTLFKTHNGNAILAWNWNVLQSIDTKRELGVNNSEERRGVL